MNQELLKSIDIKLPEETELLRGVEKMVPECMDSGCVPVRLITLEQEIPILYYPYGIGKCGADVYGQ